MNQITTTFFDSVNGRITDPIAFMAADGDVKAMTIKQWAAHNGRHALSFRDKTNAFLNDDQVGYAFLTPQLHRIEAEVYMTRYPNFEINQFMPVDTSGSMWDVGTLVYSMNQVGQAGFLSGGSFDMPYASTNMQQHTHNFHLAGIGYEWNTQEMERAAMLGRSLSSDKAKAADLAQKRFIYGIAMTGQNPAGESEKGWSGFVNAAGVPAAQVVDDGTASSRLWTAKSADLILRDINECINAVEINSNETHMATDIAIPTAEMNYIANTRVGDTGETILSFLRRSNSVGESLRFHKMRALSTAGVGSTTRMVAYDNSSQVLRFHLPGPHRFLPPFQKSSMVYEVGGIMNVGGLEIRLPQAMAYRDSF